MHRNLKAEMVRLNVTSKDIAKLLGLRYGAVLQRLNGKNRFYLDEALKIQHKFFPNVDFIYLFEVAKDVA